MMPPPDTTKPHLASGCRWGGNEQDRVVLFPEGAIRVEGTGREILEACDGIRTLQQIVEDLQVVYTKSDPKRIREDIVSFLESLHAKRIIDY
jgi:coenzyme PQQ biosynthesis protein PqqD